MTAFDQQIEGAAATAVTRCHAKPLPFIVPDPDNPLLVLSMWTVRETGDFLSDYVTGIAFSEDLIQKSKEISKQLGITAAGHSVIAAVLQEIVLKGKVGPIELGFLHRIAMAAMVASQN